MLEYLDPKIHELFHLEQMEINGSDVYIRASHILNTLVTLKIEDKNNDSFRALRCRSTLFAAMQTVFDILLCQK